MTNVKTKFNNYIIFNKFYKYILMKPTFLIIGAQKGGTTPGIWYLSQHPDIYMHQGEAHFFDNDDNYKKGVEWYEDEFFNGNKHFIRNII